MSYVVQLHSPPRIEVYGPGPPTFTIIAANDTQLQRILDADIYSTAASFVRGAFDVEGDLVAAIRLKAIYHRPNLLDRLRTTAAHLDPSRIENWIQSRQRAIQNIRFHYDVSNDFYGYFLDSRRVYSDAYFEQQKWSLEDAQREKLDRICKDLRLAPGERFLDVGCGWGGLLIHAAEYYGVRADGCTLSHDQYEFANSTVYTRCLEDRVRVWEIDYRDLTRRFDKIASVGMFEHVGSHRLGKYFRQIHSLLEDGGLFFNSGICRPQGIRSDPETSFLLRNVFPGGELVHLATAVREAERAGFSILEIRSLRENYARTCREWVERLRRNSKACIALVGKQKYRTWLLYLAASAFNFETCRTDAFSILMRKQPTSTVLGSA